MRRMQIQRMSPARAQEYISWEYAPPDTFYNIAPEGRKESLKEIFDDNGMDFYVVLQDDGTLFGIYVYSFPEGVMEIGLGISPALCGQGKGTAFVQHCISFGREQYAYQGAIRLRVARFNTRAIHLYRKIGFREVRRTETVSFGTPVTFVIMELQPQ